VIGLIDYGAGNLRSVEFALDRLGVEHVRAVRPEELAGADGVILPGVGAAARAMAELSARDWPAALRSSPVPLLGVCLGMQLLCESSDEGGVLTPGLGLIPGTVSRFAWDVPARGIPVASVDAAASSPRLPVPHIGWARVQVRSDDALFDGIADGEYFYFLHSYRAACPAPVVSATAEYGQRFPAAIRAGRVAGVQFHPEKSGPAGGRLLANFCAVCVGCAA
jgi:glutamine amidotransferase